MSADAALLRFVRRLLGGGTARREGQWFAAEAGGRIPAAKVLPLLRAGVLAGDATECRANGETAGWVRRAKLDADAFLAQHRIEGRGRDGVALNLAESPLQRLAAGEDAFLERHQVEAGERVRRLVERARLQPRLTMSYSASRIAGSGGQMAADLSDLAADSRRALQELHRVLPRDCAGVVLDVCGLLKGLQEVERERGWPRRSAKLVLRIGLDQLAQHYGLAPLAEGRASGRARAWMDEGGRPEVWPA
jgi:hypothetical protein